MTTLAAVIKMNSIDGQILFSVTHPVTKAKLFAKSIRDVSEACLSLRLDYDRSSLLEVIAQLNYKVGVGWEVPQILTNPADYLETLQGNLF